MRRFNTKNLSEQAAGAKAGGPVAAGAKAGGPVPAAKPAPTDLIKFDEKYFMNKKTGVITFDDNGKVISVDNIRIQPKYYDFQWKNNITVRDIELKFNSGELTGGDYDWAYTKTINSGYLEGRRGVVFFDKQKQEVGAIGFGS
jgi:hypothetical protein